MVHNYQLVSKQNYASKSLTKKWTEKQRSHSTSTMRKKHLSRDALCTWKCSSSPASSSLCATNWTQVCSIDYRNAMLETLVCSMSSYRLRKTPKIKALSGATLAKSEGAKRMVSMVASRRHYLEAIGNWGRSTDDRLAVAIWRDIITWSSLGAHCVLTYVLLRCTRWWRRSGY